MSVLGRMRLSVRYKQLGIACGGCARFFWLHRALLFEYLYVVSRRLCRGLWLVRDWCRLWPSCSLIRWSLSMHLAWRSECRRRWWRQRIWACRWSAQSYRRWQSLTRLDRSGERRLTCIVMVDMRRVLALWVFELSLLMVGCCGAWVTVT